MEKINMDQVRFVQGDKVMAKDVDCGCWEGPFTYVCLFNKTGRHIVSDVHDDIEFWDQVRHTEREFRPKKASEIIKWCEDEGYAVCADGAWRKIGCPTFRFEMMQHCCRPQAECEYTWLPEWLEEVEV